MEPPHAVGGGEDAPREPLLAVVVLALGAPRETVDAVRSLLAQVPPVEIAVVNSGGGGMARLLAQHGIDVPVIEREERLFVGAARNLGIAGTRAPYVAFLACDCLATPGWARERLRAHRAGSLAVGSAIVNPHPRNPFAWAAHFSLWPRRLPSIAENGLPFGASYHRSLFDKYGLFRGDLRTGEDAEFHGRLGENEQPVWRPQVQTIHRGPTGPIGLVRDQFDRGRRAARARFELKRSPFPRNMLVWGRRRSAYALRASRTLAPAEYATFVRLSRPLIRLASAAYCLGIVYWHLENRVPLGRNRD